MERANRRQRKITQKLDYKIDEYYKTHNDEGDDLFRIQAHYHEKTEEIGKRDVHV